MERSRWRPLLGLNLHWYVDRHRQTWDVVMAILAIVYVALGLAEDSKGLNLANVVVLTLAVIFFAEFLVRFVDDPAPLSYARDHWIDLVTCVPAVGPLRLLRLLRLLRVFNVAGRLRQMARDKGDASGMRVLVATVFVFWLLAGYAFYVTELNEPQSSVHSFQDALFLAFTTATSVGYSPLKPVTYQGQIVGGLVIFIGLGLLAAASSRLTSLWIEGASEQDVKDLLQDLRDQARSSESRLASIETALHIPVMEVGSPATSPDVPGSEGGEQAEGSLITEPETISVRTPPKPPTLR